MKILFIRPKPSGETIGLQHLMIVEPLELEVMAAVAGPAHHCEIADMILEKKPPEYFILKEQPDILCVTGYITNVPEMIRCCRSAKNINPEIVTITGGVHCEVCPADLDDESIDYRVVRNATVVFPQLLDSLQNGGSIPPGVLRYNEPMKSSELPPFDFCYPLPDRRLTSKYRDRYFYIFHDKVALIKTSFGCPFTCNFCFCREITRGTYHERPLEEVMEELKYIREKNIYIVDDDFLTSRTRVKRFIDANLDGNLQKNYLLYGRADFNAANPDLMAEFRTAGLRTVIVGIESFNDHELQNYNKNITAKTNEDALNILKSNKIDCYATVIVPPTWGKEDFAGCLKKI